MPARGAGRSSHRASRRGLLANHRLSIIPATGWEPANRLQRGGSIRCSFDSLSNRYDAVLGDADAQVRPGKNAGRLRRGGTRPHDDA